MKFGLVRMAGTIGVLATLFAAHTQLQAQYGWGAPPPGSAYSIPQTSLLQPEELNRMLHAPAAHRPLMLQVGSHLLFVQAHIPGSEYIGPGSQPEGLNRLRERVAPLPRKTVIVLYCGCCPWNHCPNVGPAFKLMQDMGFTNTKVLFLPANLGADWINKGYPVASGG